MDFFNAYAVNEQAEVEGRYFENGDAEFLIARAGNDRYSRMISKQYESNKHILDDKSTDAAKATGEALAKKITIDVMSKSILLGWKGNVQWQGKSLPYTVDNAQMLLGLKDFQSWVATKSGAYQNYLLSTETEDAKNSVPTSSGTSNGEVASNISET
jgi:hypothetical protein